MQKVKCDMDGNGYQVGYQVKCHVKKTVGIVLDANVTLSRLYSQSRKPCPNDACLLLHPVLFDTMKVSARIPFKDSIQDLFLTVYIALVSSIGLTDMFVHARSSMRLLNACHSRRLWFRRSAFLTHFSKRRFCP
jgi:hypothetical protein